jgi:hypothetical protein
MAHYEDGISADTAPFQILGGTYGVDFHADAWNVGSVTLKKRARNGVTWLTAMTAWSADGVAAGILPSGEYMLAVSLATGVYVAMTRIPEV